MLLFLFFVQGFQSGGRNPIGFCYFIELSPQKYANYLGTGWSTINGSIFVGLTLFFRYIDKNWEWTIVFAAVNQAIALVNCYAFVPESPSWLYSKHRYTEC